jgi:hypothetical protein
MEVCLLAEFAEGEAGAFNVCHPEDDGAKWAWEERLFEVSAFVGTRLATWNGVPKSKSREDWLTWLREEEEDGCSRGGGAPYIAAMQLALAQDSTALGPIVIAILKDGSIDIGDGWHRIGCAVRLGLSHLPAVVGVEQ